MQNRQQEPRPFLLYYAFDILYRDGVTARISGVGLVE